MSHTSIARSGVSGPPALSGVGRDESTNDSCMVVTSKGRPSRGSGASDVVVLAGVVVVEEAVVVDVVVDANGGWDVESLPQAAAVRLRTRKGTAARPGMERIGGW